MRSRKGDNFRNEKINFLSNINKEAEETRKGIRSHAFHIHVELNIKRGE